MFVVVKKNRKTEEKLNRASENRWKLNEVQQKAIFFFQDGREVQEGEEVVPAGAEDDSAEGQEEEGKVGEGQAAAAATPPATEPRLRRPRSCARCVLQATPFVASLTVVLDDALRRPASVFHKEKRLIFNVGLERLVAPTVLVSLSEEKKKRKWIAESHCQQGCQIAFR